MAKKKSQESARQESAGRVLRFATLAELQARTVTRKSKTTVDTVLKFTFDPSMNRFMSRATGRKERLRVRLCHYDDSVAPIDFMARVKSCTIQFDQVIVEPDRVCELEEFIGDTDGFPTLIVECDQLDFDDVVDPSEPPAGSSGK